MKSSITQDWAIQAAMESAADEAEFGDVNVQASRPTGTSLNAAITVADIEDKSLWDAMSCLGKASQNKGNGLVLLVRGGGKWFFIRGSGLSDEEAKEAAREALSNNVVQLIV